MKIGNMRVAARLGIGFGLVLLMMMTLNAIGLIYLASIGDINSRLINTDWVKADAANVVNATTRENAALTLQLFISPDKDYTDRIKQRIDANKDIITRALQTLDKNVHDAEGKALVREITAARRDYVASFTQVGNLLAQANMVDAVTMMRNETMPRLGLLQDGIKKLSALQKSAVEADGIEIRNHIDFLRVLILALGAFALLAGITAAVFITRGLLAQLGGEPAYAVEVTGHIAKGDLSVEIASRAGNNASILSAIRMMRNDLVSIVGNVREGAETIAAGTAQIAAANRDLSERGESQSASLEETASSMKLLTETVQRNADHAREANQLAMSASEVALKGGQVVTQVVATMASINASANRIAEIIGVIDDIAFQTNILALNAAVEAARAGEQGRGFAVVASEVRSLAQRSATAAKEIKQLISDSVQQIRTGSSLVNEAGATMEDVIASFNRVTGIMQGITSAGDKQIADISRIGQSVIRMDTTIKENAALMEEASAASATLQEQAAKLAQAVSVFKLGGARSPSAVHEPVQSEKAVEVAELLEEEEQRRPALRVISAQTRTLPLGR